MEKKEDQIKLAHCAHCRRKLDLGVDALRLENGVIGPRGFVSLSDPKMFCDEGCAEHFFANEEVVRLPRRIP